ncbi:MAG TPA: hypothetical protein VE984_12995 [Gaiellaceae bacterium]|nr:hypothetical protein [Gaiellaceae bacterium]
MGRLFVSSLVLALCCALAAGAAAAKRRPLQHVTIFSDSVGAALSWDSTARRIAERGDRVLFELHPCGRLVQPGCLTSDPPPSVLATVRTLGRRIGPNVVVFIGYNDDPATYRRGIPLVMRALRNRGAKHVLWLTLRAVNRQYVDTNHAIYAAEQKWRPLMTVLDWNHYSATHTSWYAADGIHMSGAGAVAFATYLHQSLKRLHLTGPLPGSQ